MDYLRARRAILQRVDWRLAARAALAAALVALVVWGCISTSNASNMRRKYAYARSAVGEALYSSVYMMALKYDDASLAGADVEGAILPAMRAYYQQAIALNGAIAEAFGQNCAVLGDGLLAELDQAFSAYDEAFRAGRSTDDAAALMTQAMTDVRAALDKRYDEDARLIVQ